jgi:hypothetical protein
MLRASLPGANRQASGRKETQHLEIFKKESDLTCSIDGGKNVGAGCTARPYHQARDASENTRKMDPR